MSKNSNLSTVRYTNLSAMALAFASASPKVLARLPEQTLDGLEKALHDAARTVAGPLPSLKEQIATVQKVENKVNPPKEKPTKTQKPAQKATAIELTMQTVEENGTKKLHLRTPYWVPLNIQLKDRLPKGAQRYDKETQTRIIDADQNTTVLEVIFSSFSKSQRPVWFTVDGVRMLIAAGI